jgi:hypothetical protein
VKTNQNGSLEDVAMAKRAKSGLDTAAVKVGSTLGQLARKAAAAEKQRQVLARQLRKTIAKAQAVLESIGKGGKPDADAVAKEKAAAAKARIRASWKETKNDVAGEQTKPGDVRATIRATASRRWTNRQPGKG